MKAKVVTTAMTFLAVLLCFALEPAIAGKITAYNANKKHSYHVRYERWTFGVKSENNFCVRPSSTDSRDDVVYAIGRIRVYKGGDKCEWLGGDPVKDYTVKGTFLPHRTFTVDIDAHGEVEITEP